MGLSVALGRIIKSYIGPVAGSNNSVQLTAVEEYSGDERKAQVFGASNEDAPPAEGVQTININLGDGRGFLVHVAYNNDKITPVAEQGEVRRYSTNNAGDTVKAEYFLHGDGKIELKNSVGSLVIWPDGTINSDNGSGSAIIRPSGNIELNGNTYHLVMFEQLKIAIQNLVNAYNIHWHNGTNSSKVPEVQQTLSMDGSKADSLLTDG